MSPSRIVRLRTPLIILLAAIGSTALFWLPLWLGGGFLGGDVYSYYFPQKVHFANCLREGGESCFWHPLTGFGYPLVGESQTGVFYPLHRIAYYWFDVNTAYNCEHLLHYMLAFVFATLFARKIGLQLLAALFAAFVYTYSWFPSRCCVEWAIIGGAWLPAALWCCESFLQSRHWRYAIGLSAVLAVQMLAGHFQIAFITQLLLLAYAAARLSWCSCPRRELPPEADEASYSSRVAGVILVASMLCGFGLAAVQLGPTWELKQQSQRAEAGEHHELKFGSIPAWYWSQAIFPWHWYSPMTDRNEALRAFPPAGGARTHEIEAHLYFGLVPLGLCLWAVGVALIKKDRFLLFWTGVGIVSLIYTNGRLVPLTQFLSGFSYFQGPGRFGIVTSFAVALLAGSTIDDLCSNRVRTRWFALLLAALTVISLFSSATLQDEVEYLVQEIEMTNPLIVGTGPLSQPVFLVMAVVVAVVSALGVRLWWRTSRDEALTSRSFAVRMLFAGVLVATIADLWIVSRLVTTTWLVQSPPINHLDSSPIGTILGEYENRARVVAPGANFPSVFGCASLPVYLTFGPKEYVQPDFLKAFSFDESAGAVSISDDQIQTLDAWGVSHFLSFKPIATPSHRWIERWATADPVLNRVWGRGNTPLYLYELDGTKNLITEEATHNHRLRFDAGSARIQNDRSGYVEIETESTRPGQLVLTDLIDANWAVTINGTPATAVRVEELFRGVDLPAGKNRVVWKYEPRLLYAGAWISVATLVLLATIAHLRYWHPSLFSGRRESATS